MSHDSYDDKEQIRITLLNNKIELDCLCYNCTEHFSFWNDQPATVTLTEEFKSGVKHCDICDNVRFIPTEEGLAILHLMRRYVNHKL